MQDSWLTIVFTGVQLFASATCNGLIDVGGTADWSSEKSLKKACKLNCLRVSSEIIIKDVVGPDGLPYSETLW